MRLRSRALFPNEIRSSVLSSVASVVGALLLSGCSPSPTYRSEFLAMGTTVSVEIVSDDLPQATLAANEIATRAQRLGHEWYPWTADGSGELAQLNAAFSRHESHEISSELAALLQRAREVFVSSEGYFDPAIGALVALWGFSGAERADQPLPTDDQIATWLAKRPRFSDITVILSARSQRASACVPLQLDLGAIAKGRVIDIAIDVLQRRGLHDALVDAGGNVRAIGSRRGQPWRIAIRDPRSTLPLAWLDLYDGESASTSGDYEHYALVADQRIHHLLDPHTGRPVTHTMAVTVLADDATTADAASTALMAAGPDHWREIARRMKLRYVLRVDASGKIEMSSALHSRLHFSATVSPQKLSVTEL